MRLCYAVGVLEFGDRGQVFEFMGCGVYCFGGVVVSGRCFANRRPWWDACPITWCGLVRFSNNKRQLYKIQGVQGRQATFTLFLFDIFLQTRSS